MPKILAFLAPLLLLGLTQPASADPKLEVFNGDILVRSDVSDGNGTAYLLVAIDARDKRYATDEVIDQLWLVQTEGMIAEYINLRLEGMVRIQDERRIIIQGRDSKVYIDASLDPVTGEKVSPIHDLPSISGISSYYEGFERGLGELETDEALELPWFLGPLFIPYDQGAIFSKADKALERCEAVDYQKDEKNCTAVCQFGSCKAECQPPATCPCCKCGMGAFATCGCGPCNS